MDVFIGFSGKPLLFQNPQYIISCNHPASLAGCFKQIEQAISDGYHVAGFLSYEAGSCFEEVLRQDKAFAFPLIKMGVYGPPITANFPSARAGRKGCLELEDLHLNISREKYFHNISLIRDYIQKGEVYQVTYCTKLKFKFRGEPITLFNGLYNVQPVPYPAFIRSDEYSILSLSPEMFLRKRGRIITVKPMKGTWARGNNFFSDCLEKRRFSRDEKNKAENVMIADLLRNDLGRIAKNIRVPRLFQISGYRTLYQMTSTVSADIAPDIPVYELFRGLFPSGSVTGAPKIRAMQLISDIEEEERKIYTGTIGYITPAKEFFFNVPIRTILLEGQNAQMGVGGGIVWDSTAHGEWEEGLLKARFVTDSSSLPFKLQV